jgi:hypothetical protein
MGRRVRFLILASLLAACTDPGTGAGSDDLTSVDGVEHTIDFDAFVDVPVGASDDAVKDAIHRELKSALGAMREKGIGVADRSRSLRASAFLFLRLGVGDLLLDVVHVEAAHELDEPLEVRAAQRA